MGTLDGNPGWDTAQVITEHALLPVIPGREVEFELAFTKARAIISSMPGCRSLTLSRSIESPSTYLLLVEWERLDDHTIGFRQSEHYQEWRALLHHFHWSSTSKPSRESNDSWGSHGFVPVLGTAVRSAYADPLLGDVLPVQCVDALTNSLAIVITGPRREAHSDAFAKRP